MKLKDYCLEIEKFLKDYLENTHMDCYVLGLSGGVDSSLVAILTKKAVGKEKLHCLLLPIDSNPNDLKDGLEVAKRFDLQYKIIDASKAYHALVKNFEDIGVNLDVGSLSNLKVRIRMCILYAYAQKHHGLVLGTDNADERYTGYFTKYGDGAADLLPIVHLTKKEVVEATLLYGLNDKLANRVPTAGLFEGQTDEGEMGVSYKDLDDFILGKPINEVSKKRIEHLHNISEHKRKEIPTPIPFKRDEK